jgi:leucyl-tRNA synthetase
MQALSFQNEKFTIKEPFTGLFTQGMVCHETYKDQNNNWLSPEEVTSINGKKYLKDNTLVEVKVGSSESMSKSKKNTIDPENIIQSYGADSVRLFILSDSPPEKDVQWSEEGIISSYKFIQKLWSLHKKIIDEIKKEHNEDSSDNLIKFTNRFIKKITENLENFNYNIIIANIHEMHTYMGKEINNKYSKKTLIENYTKILTLLEPVLPHLVNEAFKELREDKISWPNYDKNLIIEDIITFVIQINGKKRGIFEIKTNSSEKEILNKINQDDKLKKYLNEKEIKKKIFVPNRLINIII